MGRTNITADMIHVSAHQAENSIFRDLSLERKGRNVTLVTADFPAFSSIYPGASSCTRSSHPTAADSAELVHLPGPLRPAAINKPFQLLP